MYIYIYIYVNIYSFIETERDLNKHTCMYIYIYIYIDDSNALSSLSLATTFWPASSHCRVFRVLHTATLGTSRRHRCEQSAPKAAPRQRRGDACAGPAARRRWCSSQKERAQRGRAGWAAARSGP